MIRLELRALTVFGHEDRRTFEFKRGLNVVIGPYGSGKTSLLELIKYALGGSATLSEAVRIGVTTVVLEASLQGQALSFERNIGESRVGVSIRGEHLTTLHATSSSARGSELASHFLLRAAGLPVMRVRRSQRDDSASQESISFWDVFRYAYVSQNEMGQSIAGHADTQLNRKRRRAFELMFGLLDTASVELEKVEAQLVLGVTAESKRLQDVTAFLAATGVPTRAEALALAQDAATRREAALDRLGRLRSQSRETTDSLRPARDEIARLQSQASELAAAAGSLRFEIATRERLAARLKIDIESVRRSSVAAALLGPLDFATCPRCAQAVSVDRSDGGDCYVCLQPLADDDDAADHAAANAERLAMVLAETEELLAEDRAALRLLSTQLGETTSAASNAEQRFRSATDNYVAPLFEDIAGWSAEVASAEAEITRLNASLAQWAERAAIRTEVDSLSEQLNDTRNALVDARARLEHRRALVTEFSETFDEIVRELQVAWYTDARVDTNTYLPVLGAGNYKSLSGGQRTVVSVAYHLALLTMGLVHPDEIEVPTLLIVDTPSKYLGGKDAAQISRDYRRIAAIVEAYDEPVQIIVADNDPPPSGVRPNHRIELSYENPLVPGVAHPGPADVIPIHEPYAEDPST